MRSLDRNIVDRKLIVELVQDTRGAEIAETAAVLPILFMILLGIFWFGQAFSIYGAITRAAQEGARAGSMANCATCSGSNLITTLDANAAIAIQNALQASQLNPVLANYQNPPPPALNACQSQTGGGTISCGSGGSTNFCIQSPVQLTGTTTTGLCGVSVTIQYPFQFWLPFTSINNQLIWIQASSRVRLETR
jgi:Flp pilus assembly protein TadG